MARPKGRWIRALCVECELRRHHHSSVIPLPSPPSQKSVFLLHPRIARQQHTEDTHSHTRSPASLSLCARVALQPLSLHSHVRSLLHDYTLLNPHTSNTTRSLTTTVLADVLVLRHTVLRVGLTQQTARTCGCSPSSQLRSRTSIWTPVWAAVFCGTGDALAVMVAAFASMSPSFFK